MRLAAAFDAGQMHAGIGVKKLRHGLWEARAGLDDRLVFAWEGESVEFRSGGRQGVEFARRTEVVVR